MDLCNDFIEDLIFWTDVYAEQTFLLYELFHKRGKTIYYFGLKKVKVQF